MDVPRPGAKRRRVAVVVGAVIVPLAVMVVAWQPLKGVLVEALYRVSTATGALFGLDGAATAEPVAGPVPAPAAPTSQVPDGPTFDDAGTLVLPSDVREWVFVGAAVGLSYSDDGQTMGATSAGPGAFTHVYLDPTAYHVYRSTGAFPEGTTFVLDIHASATSESIARNGWYEGGKTGTHAAVKDSTRFPGGWGYFDVDTSGRGRPVRTDACNTCHVEHGADDNVFVQFYPLLRDVVPTSTRVGPGTR